MLKLNRTALSLLLLAPGLLRAQAPDPPWRLREAPLRAVFTVPPTQRFCLVRMPAVLTNDMPVGRVAAFHGAAPLPVRVAAATNDVLDLLVNCSGLPANATVALYAVTNGSAIVPDSSFADPRPVTVVVQRGGVGEAPPTWEEMRFMTARPLAPRATFLAEGLQPIQSQRQGPRRWYEGGWRRPVYVARLGGQLLVERAGECRLALRSRKPSYLLLDGKLVAQNPRPKSKEQWALGEPVMLTPGLHEFEALNLCDREIDLLVGWSMPDSDEVFPLPQGALLTGAGPVAARLERLGAVLHAAADYQLEPGYTFHGVPATFTPARLSSLHASWEGAKEVTCNWRMQGALLGSGPTWRHIFTAAGTQAMELEVVNATGRRATAGLNLEIPATTALEYRLAARLVGVPAICYEDDPVRPEIHLRGTAPEEMPLKVEATVSATDGHEASFACDLKLVKSWSRFVLPAGCARDYSAIDWNVSHAGVTLDSGRVVLRRQPFETLPDELDGDLLTEGEEACVLVPRRASSGQPDPLPGVRGGQRIVLLDGFLATPGRCGPEDAAAFDRQLIADLQLFGGRMLGLATNGVSFRRVSFSTLGAALRSRSLDRLAPLARLGLLLPADTVVIAPDVGAAAGGESLDDFERRLAALAGLLREAARCQVVLMTPPPELENGALPPNAATTTDAMRPYAEAVVRVADAYGLAVADFYTMCRTRLATEAVAGGVLTDAGRALAAETLARTLVSGR